MRRSTLHTAWLGCLLMLGTLTGKAVAGGRTEQLEADRPEAWALNYFTSVSLLTGLGTTRGREPGAVEIGVELDWIPKINKAKRRVGFNGVKEEDVNKAPIFFRPRLTVGLPWRLSLILSYLPPIEVFGVEPNLFALALERPLSERNPWTVGIRAYGQLGEIEGAFTCPREVVRSPPGTLQNLFGCQRESSDTATLRYGGIELSGAYRIERARGLTPYLAVAGNFLDTRFQVDALTFGVRDRRRLSAGTWTFSASAGVVYPLTGRFSVSVGLFYSPLWVTRPPATSSHNDALFNARALLTFRLR